MSAIKNYFSKELKLHMFGLSHSEPQVFYRSICQKSVSALPLLIWRSLLLLTTVSMVLFSIITYILLAKVSFWCIFLTHWGLMAILFANACAFATSLRCFISPIDDENGGDEDIPWYMKVYWVSYNIATPTALLITIFYWTVLYDPNAEDADIPLDIAVHALNSVVMLGLLLSSSLPSRLLHFYQPMLLALLYALFGFMYYLAGGTDHKGNRFVYSVVDWSKPAKTAGVVAATVLMQGALHFVVVAIAVGRDAVASCLLPDRDHRDTTDYATTGTEDFGNC